jgi:Transcription factor WhiB
MIFHARDASDRLLRALITLAARGQRTHCSDAGSSEIWLSEHEPERAEAVKLCRGCPVIQPCGQAAEERDERWGVWGGVDRSIRPGRKKAA